MAYRRILSFEAKHEYQEIVYYLANVLSSKQAARTFVAEFKRQMDLICNCPNLFALSRMPELAARGYRPIFINSYVALATVEEDVIFVAHIFHQSQDYAKLA